MAGRTTKPRVYIAAQSFVWQDAVIHAGTTRVREGHALLKVFPDAFVLVEDAPVHFDVEAASAAPGEARGDQ